jgi:peptidase M23-like protein
MRQVIILLGAFIFLCSFSTDNVKTYPQDYFRSPVGGPIFLSGTFGELRPNHFHAGIDIKANKGRVGQDLYAAADGYISRIKVASGGYGNVLYISHPNGYTTVYAHMHQFSERIAKFIKESQYNKQKFEIEIFPTANQFIVKKGEVIGKLGTSGRSFGPHLHFEIRDSRTEKPINPLLFGFTIKDNIAPMLKELKAYFLNDKLNTLDTKTYKVQKVSGNKYRIYGDTLRLGAWRAGFGIKTFDQMNGVPNWNGVYNVDMYENDKLSYSYKMESFAFSESRYINAHLDYEEQVAKKSYFNRCFRLPGNKLSIYKEEASKGLVQLSNQKATKITMKAFDTEGNESILEFWVKRGEVKEPTSKPFNYLLLFDEENVVDNKSVYVHFPLGSFYENLQMKYHSSRDDSQNVYSMVYHIHDYKTPVHQYYELGIEAENLPDSLRNKAFIAYCGTGQKMENCGGQWKGNKLTAMVRDLGDFCIMVDQDPPTITPVSFKSNMKGFSKMTFKIKDNYETSGKAADLKYRATVDGNWILMEYDAKNDLLTYRFDKKIAAGQHILRLSVIDDRGNEKIFEQKFTR